MRQRKLSSLVCPVLEALMGCCSAQQGDVFHIYSSCQSWARLQAVGRGSNKVANVVC